MLYSLITGSFFIYFKLFSRVTVTGKENIPKDGAVIFCSNHISNLDPPLLGAFTSRKIHFMAKEELFNIPIIGPVLKRCGTFPVKRGMDDRKALKHAFSILKEQKGLGIFPEGTRSKTGELGEAKSGASYFALKSDSVVIPVSITGTYGLFKRLTLSYGKPVDLTELKKMKISSETTTSATNQIMNEIKELIKQAKKDEV